MINSLYQTPICRICFIENFDYFDRRLQLLADTAISNLTAQGFQRYQIRCEYFVNMRYDRTDCALMCSSSPKDAKENSPRMGDFLRVFTENYRREFGFTIPARKMIVDDLRVRGIGKIGVEDDTQVQAADGDPDVETVKYFINLDLMETSRCRNGKKILFLFLFRFGLYLFYTFCRSVSVDVCLYFLQITQCHFKEGKLDTKVYLLNKLRAGHQIEAPAIIIDANRYSNTEQEDSKQE